MPHDLTGCSIKNPRVRVVHTTDPALAGGSLYLQQADPWLGYQWGRSLTQREFRERDGVYGGAGKLDGPLLADGKTRMMSRSHVNSCALCHNTPYRDGGAGATMAKNGGDGRNTPHMFGAGLVEMIGQQIRLEALAIADDNRDGWISPEEAKGKRCVLHNLPEGVEGDRAEIDYGSFEDLDGDGKPDLNPLFSIIYVDKDGKRLAQAKDLRSPGVAGYTFEVQCFGFGHLAEPGNPPVSTTLRSFIATPFDIHMGLAGVRPDDAGRPGRPRLLQGLQRRLPAVRHGRGQGPGPQARPDRASAWTTPTATATARRSARATSTWPSGTCSTTPRRAGARSRPACGGARRCSSRSAAPPATSPTGICARPTRTPRTTPTATPATAASSSCRSPTTRRRSGWKGSWSTWRIAKEVCGCRAAGRTRCAAFTPTSSTTTWARISTRSSSTARSSASGGPRPCGAWGPPRPTATTGPACRSNDVIRRHGGEALEARKAYTALGPEDRRRVIDFLESLVLYQTDRLPCDLDGDGEIAEHFMVAGMDTGYERFNPEWLFNVPGRIEGPILNPDGEKVTSFALTNVRAAYGLDLKYLKDSDGDGFPDVIDPAPFWRGYKDGEH